MTNSGSVEEDPGQRILSEERAHAFAQVLCRPDRGSSLTLCDQRYDLVRLSLVTVRASRSSY